MSCQHLLSSGAMLIQTSSSFGIDVKRLPLKPFKRDQRLKSHMGSLIVITDQHYLLTCLVVGAWLTLTLALSRISNLIKMALCMTAWIRSKRNGLVSERMAVN